LNKIITLTLILLALALISGGITGQFLRGDYFVIEEENLTNQTIENISTEESNVEQTIQSTQISTLGDFNILSSEYCGGCSPNSDCVINSNTNMSGVCNFASLNVAPEVTVIVNESLILNVVNNVTISGNMTLLDNLTINSNNITVSGNIVSQMNASSVIAKISFIASNLINITGNVSTLPLSGNGIENTISYPVYFEAKDILVEGLINFRKPNDVYFNASNTIIINGSIKASPVNESGLTGDLKAANLSFYASSLENYGNILTIGGNFKQTNDQDYGCGENINGGNLIFNISGQISNKGNITSKGGNVDKYCSNAGNSGFTYFIGTSMYNYGNILLGGGSCTSISNGVNCNGGNVNNTYFNFSNLFYSNGTISIYGGNLSFNDNAYTGSTGSVGSILINASLINFTNNSALIISSGVSDCRNNYGNIVYLGNVGFINITANNISILGKFDILPGNYTVTCRDVYYGNVWSPVLKFDGWCYTPKINRLPKAFFTPYSSSIEYRCVKLLVDENSFNILDSKYQTDNQIMPNENFNFTVKVYETDGIHEFFPDGEWNLTIDGKLYKGVLINNLLHSNQTFSIASMGDYINYTNFSGKSSVGMSVSISNKNYTYSVKNVSGTFNILDRSVNFTTSIEIYGNLKYHDNSNVNLGFVNVSLGDDFLINSKYLSKSSYDFKGTFSKAILNGSNIILDKNLTAYPKWIRKADSPFSQAYTHLVFDNNEVLYALMKIGTRPVVMKYNITDDTWDYFYDGSDNAFGSGSSGVYVGNSVYFIMGDSQAFRKFTPLSRSWSSLTNTPSNINYGSSSATNGTHIFVTLGSGQRDFYAYSISNNNWNKLSDSLDPIKSGSSMTFDGSFVYVLTGEGNNFTRYNPVTNSWTNLSGLPVNPTTGASLAYNSGDGLIYAVTGNKAFVYNRTTNTWSNITDLSEAIGGEGGSLAAIPSKNLLFLTIGGSSTHFYAFQSGARPYYSQGNYTSEIIPLNSTTVVFGNITFDAITPPGTNVTIRTRTSNDTITWSDWSLPYSNNSQITSPPGRYIQYLINLSTENDLATPVIGNISIGWYNINSTGDFVLKFFPPQVEGTYCVKYNLSDKYGIYVSGSPGIIIVDNSKPIINIISPENYANISFSNRILNVSVTDANRNNSNVAFIFENSTGLYGPSGNPNEWTYLSFDGEYFVSNLDVTNLANGNYKLIVRAIDIADNSNETYINVSIDNTYPQYQEVSTTTNIHHYITTNTPFNASINATDNQGIMSVICNLNGINYTYSFKEGNKYICALTSPSAEGNYNITFYMIDFANNINSTKIYISTIPKSSASVSTEEKFIYDASQGQPYTFQHNVTLINVGDANIFNANIYTYSGWEGIEKLEALNSCNLTPGESCNVTLNVTIKASGVNELGVHSIGLKPGWENNDLSTGLGDTFFEWNLTIVGNPQLNLSTELINITENISQTHTFIVQVYDTGNQDLDRTYVNFSGNFSPSWITYTDLRAGWNDTGKYWETILKNEVKNLTVNISVKEFIAGWYEGKLNISTYTYPYYLSKAVNISIFINPQMNSTLSNITDSIYHNSSKTYNLTLSSIGNAPLKDVTFDFVNSTMPKEWVSNNFNFPVNISEGNNISFNITISVPEFADAGTYNGIINITSSNKVYFEIPVEITVPRNETWNYSPKEIINVTFPLDTPGVIVTIRVNNTGNVPQNFTISYNAINSTNCFYSLKGSSTVQIPINSTHNPTSFFVPKNSSGIFYIYQGGYSNPRYCEGEVTLINNTANPKNATIFFNISFEDMPPTIRKVYFTDELGYEKNYTEVNKNIVLKTNITDDKGVAENKTFFNLTKPNGDSLMYNATCSPSAGKNVICAYTCNDTDLVGNYTVYVITWDNTLHNTNSSKFNFTAYGTTYLTANYSTYLEVENMTLLADKNITIWFNANNTGFTTAYYINISGNFSNNAGSWIFNPPSLFNLSSLSNQTYNINITVPAGTLPGDYYFNPHMNWTNPDGTLGYEYLSTSIYIRVKSNEAFNVSIPRSITVGHGETNSSFIRIGAMGNNNVTNISTSISSIPNNISVTITPSNISFLKLGESTNLEFNVSAERGTLPGIKPNFTVSVYTKQMSKVYNVSVNVPISYLWNVSLDNLVINDIANYDKNNTDIKIYSNANQNVSFNLSLAGNITNFMNLTEKEITVEPLAVKDIKLHYVTPDENAFYSGNLTIDDLTNTSAENKTININFRSFRAELNIMNVSAPNEVLAGDTISTKINLTFGGEYISENITYKVYINNTLCPIVSNVTIANVTYINCTAPINADGRNKTLRVEANYSSFFGPIILFNEKANALYYKDITPPSLVSVNAPDVELGNESIIDVMTNDNVKTSEVILQVTKPSKDVFNLTMNKIGEENYRVILNADKLTEVGYYNLTVFAKDTTGNPATLDAGSFEVYTLTVFNGTLKNIYNTPINATFKFYLPNETSPYYVFNTNETNGVYSQIVREKAYDVEIEFSNHSIYLYDVGISDLSENPIIFDVIYKSKIGIPNAKYISGFGVNLKFNVSRARISISFNEDEVDNIANLYIYKCSNFNVSTGLCQGTWEVITNVERGSGVISANVTNFSAYVAGKVLQQNLPGEPLRREGGGGGTTTTTVGGGTTFDAEALKNTLEGLSKLLNVTIGEGYLTLKSQIISAELRPGEFSRVSFRILNYKNSTNNIKLSISGQVKDFISFDNNEYVLGPHEEQDVFVNIDVPQNASYGSYYGGIVVSDGEITSLIPVAIRVLESKEKLLDLKIQPLDTSVPPGGTIRTQVDVFNLGGGTKASDIQFVLQLINPKTEQVMIQVEETFALSTTTSKLVRIVLPKDFPEGNYLLKGVAFYSGTINVSSLSYDELSKLADVKFSTALANIKIEKQWYYRTIFGMPAWLVLLTLFEITCIAIAYVWYYFAMQRKKRYKEMINFNKLPQPTEDALFVGKIAETGIRAFFDVRRLTTHTLIAGASGSGKTVAAQVIVEEALKKNIPVVSIDPTAQWTGFLRPNKVQEMLKMYPEFGMSVNDARAFPGNIYLVDNENFKFDVKKYMSEPGITVLAVNKLTPEQIDIFIANAMKEVFAANLEESQTPKLLIVIDEVHRLLSKFGGSGQGFVQVERGAREFRKWGVGLIMISQVISDFVGEIKANIGTEIQLRTKYEGDLERIKLKYGDEILKSIVKASVGTGMVQNSEWNLGRPYFVSFRPLLHSVVRLSDKELNLYAKYNTKIEQLSAQIDELEKANVDVFDIKLELKLAKDKIRKGAFDFVDIYIDSVVSKLDAAMKKKK